MEGTSAAKKPLIPSPLYRSAEGAAPPKGRKLLVVSQFEIEKRPTETRVA